MNKSVKFVIRVAVIHVFTYFVCGLIFSKIFDYESLFLMDNVKYFMTDAYSSASLIGPFAQVLRGILLGCILLVFEDNILKKDNAWLYLWIVFAGIGVICTPGASPASIESFIYTGLPLEFRLKTAPEIIFQPLLFSLMVTGNFKLNIPEENKKVFTVTAISMAAFSLGGIILALVLEADFMSGTSNPFAFAVVFAALLVYLICDYQEKQNIEIENRIRQISAINMTRGRVPCHLHQS